MKRQNTLLALTVAIASINANAELAAVGTSDPVIGFPAYYQDFGDLDPATPPDPLALDLCLPNGSLDNNPEFESGSCLMMPGDGSIPDESQPISFPDNFPDEAFYYNASADMTLYDGSKAKLVLAVEAAFTNAVQDGDQIVFSRLRYKFTAPDSGYYIVETPYSTDGPMFKNAGELVFNTDDVGVNCGQGIFTCALAGSTGPYLRASDNPGGAPKPLYLAANGRKYLTPPGDITSVTGSPIGQNRFSIMYSPSLPFTTTKSKSTDEFSLMGRIYDGSVPNPIPRSKPKLAPVVAAAQIATVATPKVSISAVDPLASEAFGDPGKFMVNLNAPSAKNIKVKYHIEGNAKKGKDYRKFNSSIVIPAGSVFGAIDVWPVNDKENERTEKVTLKLSNNGTKAYSVKGKSVANVKIIDDD